MNLNRVVFTIIIGALAALAASAVPLPRERQQAEAVGLSVPFGGQIKFILYCDEGQLLDVGPPVPGQYFVTAGTQVFAYGSFHIDAWVLGLASAVTVPCTLEGAPVDAGLPITIVGTSL